MEAVKLDARRPALASEWGSMPPLRGPLGGLRLTDQVVSRVKRPPMGLAGALQQTIGALLGTVLALLGIPLFIVGLLWLGSKSLLWLPVFLLAWLAVSGFQPIWPGDGAPGGAGLLPECDLIFDTRIGRVVPIDVLPGELYLLEGDDRVMRR